MPLELYKLGTPGLQMCVQAYGSESEDFFRLDHTGYFNPGCRFSSFIVPLLPFPAIALWQVHPHDRKQWARRLGKR